MNARYEITRLLLHRVPLTQRRVTFLLAIAVVVVGFTAGVIAQRLTRVAAVEALKTEIEQRLGLDVEIERLDLGLHTNRLTNVRLTDPRGRLSVHVEQLEVSLDRGALLAGRDVTVERLEAVGVTVRVSRVLRADAAAAESAEGGEAEESSGRRLDGAFLGPRIEAAARRLAENGSYTLRDATIHLVDRSRGELAIHDVSAYLEKRGPAGRAVTGEARHGDALVPARGTLEIEVRDGAVSLAGNFQDLPLTAAAWLAPELPWHRPDLAKASGSFKLSPADGDAVDLEARLDLRGLAVTSPYLAHDPIDGLDAVVELDARVRPASGRLELRSTTLEAAGVRTRLEGFLERGPEAYELDLRAELQETDCGDAVGALPAALLAPFDGFALAGTLAGTVRVAIDSTDPGAAVLDLSIRDRCRFVAVPEAARLTRFAQPFLHQARAGGDVLYEFVTGPGTETWTPISRVSPFLIWAVLAHEDAAFFRHRGFAEWALETALQRNLEEGRFAYGASTVSMQLAKNLFLARDKTLSRKAREALLTWYLEKVLTKAQILELYLNVIEYGPDVYGIRAAALHYFGREPIELSPAESAFLATLLPAPATRHAQHEEGYLWRGTAHEMRSLLRRMHAKEWIDATALGNGLAEIERFVFHDRPQLPPALPTYFMGGAAPPPFATVLYPGESWLYVGSAPIAAASTSSSAWADAAAGEASGPASSRRKGR